MAKPDLYIPERPEELTPTWLNEVLAARLGDNKILDAPQTILGEGEGFVGDIVQLKLKYERESEDLAASIITKMPKLANRAMVELLGAYERENMFYMTMGDDLPVRSPLLYYGEFDRDAGSEKQEQILRAANKIPNFLQGLLTRFAWWMAAGMDRYLDEVERDGASFAHSLCDRPVTLMHGDLRRDNLFFADDEVLFIDWQMVRRGAPMYDIAYLLSCGLEDRESAQPLIQLITRRWSQKALMTIH
jgi:hypothetical protein